MSIPSGAGREREVRAGVDRFRPYRQSHDGVMDGLTHAERAQRRRESNTDRRQQLWERVMPSRAPPTSNFLAWLWTPSKLKPGQGGWLVGVRARRIIVCSCK